MEQYINILIDALDKKLNILEELKRLTEGQEECLRSEPFLPEKYYAVTAKKTALASEISRLDEGFAAVYGRTAPKLKEEPGLFAEQIGRMQGQIAKISDITAKLQAKELRLSSFLQQKTRSEEIKVHHSPGREEAAMKYYRTMKNKNSQPGSIFLDSKK